MIKCVSKSTELTEESLSTDVKKLEVSTNFYEFVYLFAFLLVPFLLTPWQLEGYTQSTSGYASFISLYYIYLLFLCLFPL